MVENIFIKELEGHELFAFDYCAQWGSTEGNGPLFYNVGVEADEWTKEDWEKFAKAIDENIALVKSRPSDFDADEVESLEKLKDWALVNSEECRD